MKSLDFHRGFIADWGLRYYYELLRSNNYAQGIMLATV